MTDIKSYRRQYIKKVTQIQRDLSRYSYVSFIEQAISYLSQDFGPEKNLTKMPWIVVLAIKWSALHGHSGKKKVQKSDFLSFVNRIYKLQHLASELGKEGVNWKLSLRRFFLNQRWYQTNDKDGLLFLTRCHLIMCDRPFDQNYYEKAFVKENKLSLDAFFKMSLDLSKTLYLLPTTALVKLDIGQLIAKFSPSYSLDDIAAFIKFISVDIESLPEHFISYDYDNSPAIEYFEVTPLKHKPFIKSNNNLIGINPKITMNGLTELITDFFIKNNASKFTKSFGKDFESYVKRQISSTNLKSIDENDISEIYTKHKISGEVVDFLTIGSDSIFIEAKGIQPNKENILTSDDKNLLKDKLSKSFLKGFGQAQECRFLLNKISYQCTSSNFALIVTHKDFFILNAADYVEQIEPDLEKKVIDEFGYLPIPLEHCFFITIHDLEVLLLLVEQSKYSLAQILEIIVEREKSNETSRMSFSDHITDIDKSRKYASTLLTNHFDSLAEESAKREAISKRFWSGNVPLFLRSVNFVNAAIENK